MEVNGVPEKEAEIWETSVGELMIIFKRALAAIDPYLEKAHISSKEGEQYDDYDAIAEMLYRKIVINSINWSFTDDLKIEIPRYGFEFDSEKQTAFIEVCSSAETNQREFVFQNFSTDKNLFDKVACYPAGTAKCLLSDGLFYLNADECTFRLRYKQEGEFRSRSILKVLL